MKTKKALRILFILIATGLLCLVIFEAIRLSIAYSKTEQIRAHYLSSNTISLPLDNIPKPWIDILLKVEDPNFYQHKGVDVTTPGAGLTTITQALTKYMYFEKFKPGFAKLEQTLIARFILNSYFSKKQQLTIFFNSAYLGSRNGNAVRGFPKAAKMYYDKAFHELTQQEYLSLVAMLMAPKYLDPIKYPERNQERISKIEKLISGQYIPSSVTDISYDKN